jgi:Ohr subfamily peroxiredoxin
MSAQAKVLYTAKTHTTGGREKGVARSSDGRLDVRLSTPGAKGEGTNPEQLFAAGWSACFEGALGVVAKQRQIALPEDTAIDAEVDLNLGDGGFFLRARLNVIIPGVEREVAEALVKAAHEVCPYSKATRGNIDVTLNVV